MPTPRGLRGWPVVGLHHPKFDPNDDLAPVEATFFARLAEPALPMP